MANRIVLVRFEQFDIISLRQVIQRKQFSGQEFVEKPLQSGIFAGRPRVNVFKQLLLHGFLEQAGEDREVRSVIFKREFKLIAQTVPGPVVGRIHLLSGTCQRVDPVSPPGRNNRGMPIGDCFEIVPLDQSRLPGRPEYRLILVGFNHGLCPGGKSFWGVVLRCNKGFVKQNGYRGSKMIKYRQLASKTIIVLFECLFCVK